MGKIHVSPNPDPQGPPLKIEVQGCPPAADGTHYAHDFQLELQDQLWMSPPKLIPWPPAKPPPPEAPANPAEQPPESRSAAQNGQ